MLALYAARLAAVKPRTSPQPRCQHLYSNIEPASLQIRVTGAAAPRSAGTCERKLGYCYDFRIDSLYIIDYNCEIYYTNAKSPPRITCFYEFSVNFVKNVVIATSCDKT
jgi:hypothetical protein